MATSVLTEGFSRSDSMGPVASVYRMVNEKGLPDGHEPHFHPATLEICYIIHGHLDWWVGSHVYKVESGDIIVMQAGTAHGSIDSTLQPCEYCTVHIDPSKFQSTLSTLIENTSIEGLYPSATEIGSHLLQIHREHLNRDAASEEICLNLCSIILLTLSRGVKKQSNRCISPLVQKAKTLLLAHHRHHPQIGELAKKLGVSTVLLNKRFQEEVGESPGRWIRSRTIAEAKTLLAVEGVAVTTVATRLGFRTSQYFASAFKRETGISPRKYRDQYRAATAKRRIAFADRAEI